MGIDLFRRITGDNKPKKDMLPDTITKKLETLNSTNFDSSIISQYSEESIKSFNIDLSKLLLSNGIDYDKDKDSIEVTHEGGKINIILKRMDIK